MKTFSNTTKRMLATIALVIAGAFSAIACHAGIRTELPGHRQEGLALLPVDSSLGIVVQPNSSEQHAFLYNALSSGEYGYEWMQRNVKESSRSEVGIVLGSWLADNLPLKGILMSQAHENEDASVSINVRDGLQVVCFVVESSLEEDGTRIFSITAAKML